MFQYFKQLILSLTFIAGLFIVIVGELPGNSLLWREAQNTAHIFAFGFLAIISLLLVQSTSSLKKHHPAWTYLIAAMISLLAGIAIEFIQMGIGRDAEVHDVLRDLLGIYSFLGLYAYFDPVLSRYRNQQNRKILSVVMFSSSALLVAGLIPLTNMTLSTVQRNIAFPTLIDFGQRWPSAFITTQDAELSVVNLPAQWQHDEPQRVSRMTVYPARYPGFALHEPVADWSGYTALLFYVYSEATQPFKLALRINDRQHNQEYEDRYTTSFKVMPGANSISIPLDEIRNGPVDRELDMQRIDKLMLFAVEPEQPLQFYLSNFYLD